MAQKSVCGPSEFGKTQMNSKRVSLIGLLSVLLIAQIGTGYCVWCRMKRQAQGAGKASEEARGDRSATADMPGASQKPDKQESISAVGHSNVSNKEPGRVARCEGSGGDALKNDVQERACGQTAQEEGSRRLQVVAALGQTGMKALPELADFLTDPDKGVRQAAFGQWKRIVAAIPDPGKRSRLAQAEMSVIEDEAHLRELAEMLASLPLPFAVHGLSNVIESPCPGAAGAARAEYLRLTGTAYSSPAASEAWLRKSAASPNMR